MATANSPLRYPGGKAVLSGFLGEVLRLNGLRDGVYVEPYAGGAGAALNLLFGEHVQRVVLNDLDPCISVFWNVILRRSAAFMRRVEDTPVTIAEWKRQRDIYRHQARHSAIRVAFAGFYLNRCNRSGIMVDGGPIGGIEQKGKWKLDARYNKKGLAERIERIALYRDRIDVYNMDAVDFLKHYLMGSATLEKTLVYLDPPYYTKGSQLYHNHYEEEDHAQLARFMNEPKPFKWIMSYDNVPPIDALYRSRRRYSVDVSYCAHTRRLGSELLICSDDLEMPALVEAEPVSSAHLAM
ncbi:MAG TPA: DNA adenine methylase [Anaerolineae bacterium]|nr:DNA adenine methylase [Anaerolineae bacterium]